MAPVALSSVAAVLILVGAGAGCSRLVTPSPGTGSSGRSDATTFAVEGQPAPGGTGALEAISCGSPVDCWAVGQPPSSGSSGSSGSSASSGPTAAPPTVVIDATPDGGLHWTAETVAVANPTALTAIACSDRHDCMAVGTVDVNGPLLGTVLVTTDGGRSWSTLAPPSGSVDLSAITCSTAGRCMVLATGGATYWSASTTDGGQVWQRGGALPPGFGGISSVACSGATQCVTVGYQPTSPGKGTGAVAVTNDGGTTWTAGTVPPGSGLLHGVACPAPQSCIAVGTTSTTTTDVAQGRGQILSSTDGGSTWAPLTAPPGIDDAFSISCPTILSCATAGTVWTPTNPPTPIGSVVTTSDGGTTWIAPRARYIPEGLTGVDCPAATACLAAGNDVVARVALPSPPKHRSAKS
jgi:photosystem II stability/assembly factor-like uncharacterized protein